MMASFLKGKLLSAAQNRNDRQECFGLLLLVQALLKNVLNFE
jgi:hypothetical protein